MTARTTTLKGGDAGAYYVEKELGYYLDRGEPAGRWQGRGAASLQLGDTVDEESFLSLMAGEDPRTGRALGTKHTDKTDRGFDVTCSAPKGVSVLFAVGGGNVRREVLEAHDTAVAAMVDWIERHATPATGSTGRSAPSTPRASSSPTSAITPAEPSTPRSTPTPSS